MFGWLRNIFERHTLVTQPATNAVISTSTLTPLPSGTSQTLSPVTLPPSVIQSSLPFPVVVCGDVVCLDSERDMIAAAFVHLNKIISTAEFRADFLSRTYTETNDRTPQQSFDWMVSQSPIKVNFTMFDGTWVQNHIDLTEGYEDENYPGTVFANRYFMQGVHYCASLILHEVMHVLGYHHYQAMSTSYPYQMNDSTDVVAKEIDLTS